MLLISIVVPAFNVGLYIEDCLNSLLTQTYSGWQCFVVDDGSTDDTADRVLSISDKRIRLLRVGNGGVSRARNLGLAEVKTPFTMFLDGDDILHPEALGRLLVGIDNDDANVVAFGAMRKILPDGSPYPGEKSLKNVVYPSGDILKQMLHENFLANGGQALVRTEAALRIGGFSELLKLSEDWEFWCRLALEGRFQYIGAPPEVFSLRMRPGSASGGLSAEWQNHLSSINTVLSNYAIRNRFTKLSWNFTVRRIWASHRWECGRVNFTLKRFSAAHYLMLQSLLISPTVKRIVLYILAILSQFTGRSFVSRLRFRDDDLID